VNDPKTPAIREQTPLPFYPYKGRINSLFLPCFFFDFTRQETLLKPPHEGIHLGVRASLKEDLDTTYPTITTPAHVELTRCKAQ